MNENEYWIRIVSLSLSQSLICSSVFVQLRVHEESIQCTNNNNTRVRSVYPVIRVRSVYPEYFNELDWFIRYTRITACSVAVSPRSGPLSLSYRFFYRLLSSIYRLIPSSVSASDSPPPLHDRPKLLFIYSFLVQIFKKRAGKSNCVPWCTLVSSWSHPYPYLMRTIFAFPPTDIRPPPRRIAGPLSAAIYLF